jgi:hypothetical protein
MALVKTTSIIKINDIRKYNYYYSGNMYILQFTVCSCLVRSIDLNDGISLSVLLFYYASFR